MLANDDPARVVVIKPNWIQESHEYRPEVWEPVITHPELILAAIEAVAERLRGQGTICICDAPHTYADFQAIIQRGDLADRIDALRRRWSDLAIEVIDLRRETWVREEEVVVERRPNPDDPRGYARLNLGQDSKELQEAAAQALATIGTDEARSVLQEVVDQGSGDLKEFCRQLLK